MCLTETKNGILLEDIMVYAMPFGWFGQFINAIMVAKKLERIFDTRRDYLAQKWGYNDQFAMTGLLGTRTADFYKISAAWQLYGDSKLQVTATSRAAVGFKIYCHSVLLHYFSSGFVGH